MNHPKGIELSLNKKDLIIRRQQLEIDRLRVQLESLIGKTPEWITPLEVERISGYTAYKIRKAIDNACNDTDSTLIDRYHYKRRKVGRQYRYLVNWSAFKHLIDQTLK
jgi:hypothetical protein